MKNNGYHVKYPSKLAQTSCLLRKGYQIWINNYANTFAIYMSQLTNAFYKSQLINAIYKS